MPIPQFLNDLRRTETEVSVPKFDTNRRIWTAQTIIERWCDNIEVFKRLNFRATNSTCLIIIAAQNEDEFNAIFEPFKKTIRAIGHTPIALQIQQKHTPELSKPSKGYEACIEGCCMQIENMLSENESDIKYFLEMFRFHVHSVYVGTIRNYIDFGTFSDKTVRTIEHNVAVYSTFATLHRSSTPRAFSQISRGITVPGQFLEVGGSSKNFWGHEANNLDWYKIALDTGKTRGTILKECTAGFFAKHAHDLFRFDDDSIWGIYGATSNFSVYKIDYSKGDIIRIEFSSDKSNSDTTGSEKT
ncbi:uncharacterized protein EAF02_010766 [Botrytis sinoallii]|uniref:uncharacterized protein n=1 Tax=Botrytis sinoallii TaxID=1463999 RepID=UPI0018FFD67E|nr:uncharacterized protein EAF02_010766 [Botrytis sinoallii]KAF7860532.1 hypothetical protein EAF02_010766 [Botrytis sinoallii]